MRPRPDWNPGHGSKTSAYTRYARTHTPAVVDTLHHPAERAFPQRVEDLVCNTHREEGREEAGREEVKGIRDAAGTDTLDTHK